MEVDGWMDGVDSSHFFGQKKTICWRCVREKGFRAGGGGCQKFLS